VTHFSYNDSDLSTELNQVRRLISDVNSTGPLFSDEEIEFYIDQGSNIYEAASIASLSLKAKFADAVKKTVGKLSIESQQKSEHYGQLAIDYAAKSKVKGGIQLFAGGLSKTQKNTERSDTDRVDPSFRRDFMDFPGTGLSEGDGST